MQFQISDKPAIALHEVGFDLEKGETLGIVGESGSGKSVTALSIMRLIPKPGKITNGQILLNSEDLLRVPETRMRDIRGNLIAMIFQEPMTSLNPLFTVGDQISEMFIRHKKMNKKRAMDCAIEMLNRVQIPSPKRRAGEYPHQLSGGMRQRVMIAMALSCEPELLIADEPTTALDVTIQAQVMDLMDQLKSDFDTAIMMITHDLGVIAEMVSRVVVMYAGRVMEVGRVLDIFDTPLHPYTEALLQSVPKLGRRIKHGRKPLHEIPGMVPGLLSMPTGCPFSPRCTKRKPACEAEKIGLSMQGPGRMVRCLLYA